MPSSKQVGWLLGMQGRSYIWNGLVGAWREWFSSIRVCNV